MLAAKSRIRQSPELIQIDREDCKHPFWLRVTSSDVPAYEQVFTLDEYKMRAHETPSFIVDAGANIGLATIWFANRFPQAKILAIEPESNNFWLLKKNTCLYPNIIPIQAAVWNENKSVLLTDPGAGCWGFQIEHNDATSQPHDIQRDQVLVNGMTIETIMDSFDFPHIDILKIDIEGAEKELFTDTSAWIDKVNTLIVELHERMKPGCNRSFYNGTNGFDMEWRRGENILLSRIGHMEPEQ